MAVGYGRDDDGTYSIVDGNDGDRTFTLKPLNGGTSVEISEESAGSGVYLVFRRRLLPTMIQLLQSLDRELKP